MECFATGLIDLPFQHGCGAPGSGHTGCVAADPKYPEFIEIRAPFGARLSDLVPCVRQDFGADLLIESWARMMVEGWRDLERRNDWWIVRILR
jgi:hypothetical protein